MAGPKLSFIWRFHWVIEGNIGCQILGGLCPPNLNIGGGGLEPPSPPSSYAPATGDCRIFAKSKKCKAFLIWHIKLMAYKNLVGCTYNSLSIEHGTKIPVRDMRIMPFSCLLCLCSMPDGQPYYAPRNCLLCSIFKIAEKMLCI